MQAAEAGGCGEGTGVRRMCWEGGARVEGGESGEGDSHAPGHLVIFLVIFDISIFSNTAPHITLLWCASGLVSRCLGPGA